MSQKIKFVLRLKSLLALPGAPANIMQISNRAGIAYPTAHRMAAHPEVVKEIDLSTLCRVLADGCGMTPDEIMRMPLGDLLDIAPAPGGEG